MKSNVDGDGGLGLDLTKALSGVLKKFQRRVAPTRRLPALDLQVANLTTLLQRFKKAFYVREVRLQKLRATVAQLHQELERVRAEVERLEQERAGRKKDAQWRLEVKALHESVDRERRTAERLTRENARLLARLAEVA